MERGTKDEGFVGRALAIANAENARWIANQVQFNGLDDAPLPPAAKAAVVTAVGVYTQQLNWPEDLLAEAVAISTCGQARRLIDRARPLVREVVDSGPRLTEKLTERDHDNMDALIGSLLDDHKAGAVTKKQVIGTLAHIMGALDLDNYGEVRVWLAEGRKYARG